MLSAEREAEIREIIAASCYEYCFKSDRCGRCEEIGYGDIATELLAEIDLLRSQLAITVEALEQVAKTSAEIWESRFCEEALEKIRGEK